MTPGFQRDRPVSFLARLDFRAKAALFVAVTVIAALWDDPWLGGGLMLVVLLLNRLAGIPAARLSLLLRAMLPFFLLLLLTHGFFNVQHVLRLTGRAELTPLLTLPDGWWAVGGRVLSREGLFYGANVLCKSATFLLLVPLCVSTTEPHQLVVGLVRLRVPYTLAFVVASTLRFFPLLFEEMRGVIETQRLRGFAIEEMSGLERVQTYAKIAVPVILGAMFKAQHIEVVLQARAFNGGSGRTYLHDPALRRGDWAVIAAAGLGLAGAGALHAIAGLGRFAG